jgi:4,5-dihydroxyphthalate decarboxylase
MSQRSRRQFIKTAACVAGASFAANREGEARQAGGTVPKISLACSDYLRFTPLATGDLRPKNVDLTWIRGPRSDMLRRALSDPAIDGGETSMLGHLLRVDRGDRSMVAVPAFPLRNFTARDLYARKGSSLSPSQLNGSRIGIYNWAASGAVWYRHLIRYFGQDPAAIKWIVGGTDEPSKIVARAPLPSYVNDAPEDKSLTDLLLAGDVDAIFVPLPPKNYHPVNGPIVRLLPEYRSVEREYFEKTRCFPPQHLIVLRREVWEKNPSLGPLLLEIFEQCETKFQEDLHHFPYTTPWQAAEVEETDLLMGPDFHAHGLEKNRHALDVFCQSAFDDGQTKRRVTVDEYFAEFLKS